MPKKNFRSLFRGSKIRLSFFIQTGKNIYLTSSRHRLVEGHSPEGQEPAAFYLPSCKKESPAALVMLQGFSQDGDYLLSHLRSTIGVTKLNFSVRNGKRWNLRAIVT